MPSLDSIDRAATLALNSLHCPASDWLWRVLSMKAVWIPVYALILFLLVRRLGWRRAGIAVLAIALTILCCDQGAGLIKGLIARPRPCHDADMLAAGLNLLEAPGGMYGFFSGHAANVFGLAAGSSMLLAQDRKHRYGWYRCCIYFWAGLVSLSRVFVGKHYLGDVLVGALFGALVALIICAVARKLTDKV